MHLHFRPMSAPHHSDTPRQWAADIPATGAWMPGDPVQRRRFHELCPDRAFVLESGETLEQAVVAYETWGELSPAGDNAILIPHALTGDAHASGLVSPHDPDGGWWNGEGLIGPGAPIDTDRYFVVCANVLGGCQGSTGPASIDPATGRHYGMRFPTITIRDIVRSQASLANELGVVSWHSVVGGSMGAMQVLEWAFMYPERVRSIVAMAIGVAATPWQIAWSASGRVALSLDPKWRGGDYYEAEVGDGPHAGLAAARSIAQITYRSDIKYQQRFGRSLVDPSQVFGRWDRFQVESYLDYHGEKLARRFDANSYLILNRAMDLHDLSRGRGTMDQAFRALKAPLLTMSLSSDVLYQPHLQSELADLARHAGVRAEYQIIESEFGHDGFLLETDAIGPQIAKFIESLD